VQDDDPDPVDDGDVGWMTVGIYVPSGSVENPEPALNHLPGRQLRRRAGSRSHPGWFRPLAGQQAEIGVADQLVGEQGVELVVVADAAHGHAEPAAGDAVDDYDRRIIKHAAQAD
jgi:hypothetical protein